jgi:TetR/AcrR family transcriptional regulator
MRLRILSVAERVFGETGYHGARVHDHARRAGIQKASLFHYFASKEALYRAVIDRGYEDTAHDLARVLATPAAPRERVRALLDAYVEQAARHPDRLRILVRQALGDAPRSAGGADMEPLVRAVAHLVREAQPSGRSDAVALVLSIVGTVAFLLTSAPSLFPGLFPDPGSRAAVDRVKRHVADIVDRALGPDEGEPSRASHRGSPAHAPAPG